MWRKILNILSWMLIVAYLVVSLAFTENILDERECVSVRAIVRDSAINHFIKSGEINAFLVARGMQMHGVKMGELDQAAIRQAVLSIPGVRNVNVYATPDGILTIDVWQREPLFRYVGSGASYYIDAEGNDMPLSPNHTARVLIVTGESDRAYLRDSLKPIVEHIREQPFLDGLIHGIHVAPDHTLELFCRIGDHRVLMGSASDYEWKFLKLKSFYEKGMPVAGWKRYQLIDLRYSDQVVARLATRGKEQKVQEEATQPD
ncbi:MAG: hypothetical protein R6V75_04065 [Bacteroidales bacterium]